jgi:hypothetical protein
MKIFLYNNNFDLVNKSNKGIKNEDMFIKRNSSTTHLFTLKLSQEFDIDV